MHVHQSKALGIHVTESAAVRRTSSSVSNVHCNETSELSHPPESAGRTVSEARRWISGSDGVAGWLRGGVGGGGRDER